MPPPFDKGGKTLRPTGAASITRAIVGRDALIPPDPAAAQTPAGGINPSPYKPRRAHGQPENHKPCFITNLCRGRCSHRPANLAAAGTFAGGYGIRPYERGRALRSPGTAATTRTTVGRGALTPPHPAVAQTPGGGINPAPTNGGGVRGQPPPSPCLRPVLHRPFPFFQIFLDKNGRGWYAIAIG